MTTPWPPATPYCTVADVQALISWALPETNTTGNPSTIGQDTVTNDIIPQVSQYIDDRLAQYYVTPITGTNALTTMNRIARYLAAAEVLTRKYTGEAPNNSTQATTYRQLAETDLTNITTGVIILYDAQTTGDTPESISHQITDNLSSPLAPRRHFHTRMRF